MRHVRIVLAVTGFGAFAILVACVDDVPTPDRISTVDASSVEAGGDGASPTSDAGTDAAAGDEAGGDAGPGVKKVFVTSHTYNGNLGGLTGADRLCASVANSVGLSGTYKAWLSSSQESPATRFVHHPGPYVLAHNPSVVIANSWTDLTSGTLRAPINMTEGGGPAPPGTDQCISNGNPQPVAWTSTFANGTADVTSGNCNDWSNTDVAGSMGEALFTTNAWTSGCSVISCATLAALYCFEQ